MVTRTTARRSANALFKRLDPSMIESARSGLEGLRAAMAASSHLTNLLQSPVFTEEEKLAVLSELSRRLACPPPVEEFLTNLVKNNRAVMLPEIAEAFHILADEAQGRERVSVRSAQPMEPSDQETIRERLHSVIGRDIDLTFQTKPDLLCGLQILVGNTVYDGTLRGRLSEMRSLLTKG